MPRPRRSYTKREKLAAVVAAEMSGITEASKQTGIPKQTIDYWMDDPEFGRIRTKTREDLADEIKVVAHLAWQRIAKALADGTMEPRDAIFAADKATSLRLLMSGDATSRTETRDITGSLEDSDIAAAIREAVHLTAGSGEGAPETPEDPPAG